MNRDNIEDGYTCKCKKYHKFPAYVYAHYDIELTHVCECGRKNIIKSGKVKFGNLTNNVEGQNVVSISLDDLENFIK